MADLTQCDGCGIISPDKEGSHIANSWTKIKIDCGKVHSYYTDNTKELILCEECLPSPDNNYNLEKWAKSIKEFFSRKKTK